MLLTVTLQNAVNSDFTKLRQHTPTSAECPQECCPQKNSDFTKLMALQNNSDFTKLLRGATRSAPAGVLRAHNHLTELLNDFTIAHCAQRLYKIAARARPQSGLAPRM